MLRDRVLGSRSIVIGYHFALFTLNYLARDHFEDQRLRALAIDERKALAEFIYSSRLDLDFSSLSEDLFAATTRDPN